MISVSRFHIIGAGMDIAFSFMQTIKNSIRNELLKYI